VSNIVTPRYHARMIIKLGVGSMMFATLISVIAARAQNSVIIAHLASTGVKMTMLMVERHRAIACCIQIVAPRGHRAG
jgi:hypothetical protein